MRVEPAVAAPPAGKRESRREAILDIAQTCFLATGYGSTSMSTIAEQVGGSKATLYQYFSSKEALFDAVLRRVCDRLQRQFSALPPTGDARERLVQMATDLLNHLLSPEGIAIYRLVVAESERFPTLGRLFYEAGPRAGAARMAQMIRQLIDDGSLRRADAMAAAQQFGDLVLAGILNRRLWRVIDDPTPAEIQRHARAATDMFLQLHASDDDRRDPGGAKGSWRERI